MIRFGNAPCSWGTIEGIGSSIGYAQMLDELKASGYEGTELGDYGYMPTDPQALRHELETRGLTMLGGYEGVNFRDPAAHADGEARVLRNARLMHAVADSDWLPYVVLADQHSLNPVRFKNAGRITPEMSLSDADWDTFASGVNRVAKAVHDETGLRSVFHHHCAGYVETPDDIAALLERTDPNLVGLVFDTGHYLYGTGQIDGKLVLDGLERFKDRIWYVHFKDCNPEVATKARAEEFDYNQSIGAGVFCELGAGAVPFRGVLDWLEHTGYDGWITVEQDVLPGMGEPKVSAQHNREYLARIQAAR
jgi:inosose dehydratase